MGRRKTKPPKPVLDCPWCNQGYVEAESLAWHLYKDHEWHGGCPCGKMKLTLYHGYMVATKRHPYIVELIEHILKNPDMSYHLAEAALLAAARKELLDVAREKRGP